MLRQIDEHTRQGRSFAFETTLSGHRHARRIPIWQEQGYRVKLFVLRLPTPEAAIARVAQRVAEGGHSGPQGARQPAAKPAEASSISQHECL